MSLPLIKHTASVVCQQTFPVTFSVYNLSDSAFLISFAYFKTLDIFWHFLIWDTCSLFLSLLSGLKVRSSFLEIVSFCMIQILWRTMHARTEMQTWAMLLSFFLRALAIVLSVAQNHTLLPFVLNFVCSWCIFVWDLTQHLSMISLARYKVKRLSHPILMVVFLHCQHIVCACLVTCLLELNSTRL